MDHWVNLKGKEDMGGNGWGLWINLLKKNVWSAGRRGWKPLMLTAGNFLTSVWLTTLMLQWGASVQPCSGILCLWVVVLIMWQLERLIVDKQQDYEEGFTGLKGTVVGRPLICQPKRKLVRAGWSRLKKGEGGKGGSWSNGRRETFRILKQNEEDIVRGWDQCSQKTLICTSFYSTFRVQLVLQWTTKWVL